MQFYVFNVNNLKIMLMFIYIILYENSNIMNILILIMNNDWMYVANMYMDLILIIFVLDMYSIFGDRVGYVIILCIDILDDNQ